MIRNFVYIQGMKIRQGKEGQMMADLCTSGGL
jgi:hypothetical protein